MDTIPCSVYAGDVSLVVSGSRSSRAAISDFLGCFFGRYFILSMFECHVKFERIFDKILNMSKLQNRLILLYQSLPLHHSPGSWLVVPGKRRLAASENSITLTAGGRHPDFQETRTSPCLTATILVDFRSFSRKISYCLGIFTKLGTGFSTSSRARVVNWLKLVWATNFR